MSSHEPGAVLHRDVPFGIAGTAGIRLHDALGRGRETAGGKNYPVPDGMLETAENLRRDYSISREDQDELALRSQQRAGAAVADGRFDDEIVPVTVASRKGDLVLDNDETPRPDTTVEVLAGLKPVLIARTPSRPSRRATRAARTTRPQWPSSRLPSAPPNSASRLLVRLVTWARAGVEPSRMGLGPVPAVAKAFERSGLAMSDMDLIELNEAFAAQVLAVTRQWKLTDADWERVNVNGSGISLGHPVGATGARILTTASRHLVRTGGRYLLETMCIGGGQGLAAIFERA